MCPITTPSWSVYFGRAGALVTDGGSLLAHAAVIAREHRVPAVVATHHATATLQDGTIVEVDGRLGTIQVEGEPSTERLRPEPADQNLLAEIGATLAHHQHSIVGVNGNAIRACT